MNRLCQGFLALVLGSGLLAGCTGGKIHLTLGIFAGSNWGVPTGNSYRFYDQAIAQFQAAHPDITVTYRSGTLKEDYSEWLAQKIVQGTEPDVMLVLDDDFDTYSSIGVLEDLTPWMARDPGFQSSSFYPNVLQAGRFQDGQFGLPVEINPTLMFVNTSLLSDLGLEVPRPGWTWDDFLVACRKVSRDGDNDGNERFGATRFSWRSLAFSDGWQPYSPRGTEANFDRPGFVHTVAFVSEIRALNHGRVEPDFDSGKVAFAPDSFSNYRAYEYYPYRVKRFAHFQWQAIEMPRGPGGLNSTELPTLLLGMSHRSAHKEEAWQLLKLLTSDPGVQLGILRDSTGWPASARAVQDPEVPEILRKNFPGTEGLLDVKVIGSIVEKAVIPPRFRRYDQIMNTADQELYRIIEDPFDLENRLHKLNQQLNALLRT